MTIRTAVVGGGTFGEMHLRALTQFRRTRGGELVGVVDLNEALAVERSGQFGVPAFTDLDEMLETMRPDAVTVATPDHLHRDVALRCLAAGAHVLVEKPLDVTVEGCEELIAAAADADRILHVDFMKRHDLYHRDLARRVREGQVGNVQYGYAWMEDRIEVPRDWLPDWASRSDPAWFLGVHVVDLIRWVIGAEPVAVSASGWKDRLAGLGIDTYDAVQARFVFDGGQSFTVDVAWHLPDGNEAVVNQGIKVVGSEGWLTVDSQYRGARGCLTGQLGAAVGADRSGDQGAVMFTPNLGLFAANADVRGEVQFSGYAIDSIMEFADHVAYVASGAGTIADLAGRYPSGEDGLAVTRAITGVHRSLEQGGALVDLGGR